MDKITEIAVKGTPVFIDTELGHHLAVIQIVSFLEQTDTSSEQSPVEFCAALRQELLLIVGEMTEEVICLSPYCLKLTTAVRRYLNLAIVLAREDAEVHLHAAHTWTEHFWLCVWANYHLENRIIVRKQHLDRRMQLVT
jgi:hypothetical protein